MLVASASFSTSQVQDPKGMREVGFPLAVSGLGNVQDIKGHHLPQSDVVPGSPAPQFPNLSSLFMAAQRALPPLPIPVSCSLYDLDHPYVGSGYSQTLGLLVAPMGLVWAQAT